MPFTPFHFGPGLLAKGVAPRAFSFSTFVSAQVVIDCESLYNIVNHHYPVHRELHTLVGAVAAGLGTAAAVLAVLRVARSRRGLPAALEVDLSTRAVWIGGFLGGASHPLLDGIMHPDVRPFLPWSPENPLLGAMGPGALHLACMASGIVGLALLMAAHRRTVRG